MLLLMQRFRRYPGLTIVTIAAFVVLCGLMLWQVERLFWKQALIAQLEETRSQPPLAIQTAAGLEGQPEFRRVVVEGSFRHDLALHLHARYHKGNLGFQLIVPLVLKDGSAVLINRGWVPKDYKINPKVKIAEPAGGQRLIGIIRKGEAARSYLPQNDPEKGLWLWQSPEQWAAATREKLPAITPLLVQQTHHALRDDGFPIPQEASYTPRNDHLHYAITWGLLALALLVVYGVYTRK